MNLPTNPIQAMMDGLSAQMQKSRSVTQLTLGQLIDRLAELPPETSINLGSPHSYRGYYEDLAFESILTTAREALETCRACMGETFEGYKGGDFQMGRNTPVWLANYRCCGDKIMSINDDGTPITAKDE